MICGMDFACGAAICLNEPCRALLRGRFFFCLCISIGRLTSASARSPLLFTFSCIYTTVVVF